MTPPPDRPKVYHITHVDNLAAIVADGGLVSDAAMIRRGGPPAAIGMAAIKRRRVDELDVACHVGTRVGDYVPFYFCPRSIMLYVIHRANHPELAYRGGQEPIVHLEADLLAVVDWAAQAGRLWAFSLSNAGAYYRSFRNRVEDLHQLDWQAIAATDFRSPEAKEAKQAEFLVHESFPWHLVERIGVRSMAIAGRAQEAIMRANHLPRVDVLPGWYY